MKHAKALFEATDFKHVKEIIPDSTKVASITHYCHLLGVRFYDDNCLKYS